MLTSSPSPSSFTPSSPRFYKSQSSPHLSHSQSHRGYSKPPLPPNNPAVRERISTPQPIASQTAPVPISTQTQTSDASTQYTPPDYPPTSAQSSLRLATHDVKSESSADPVAAPGQREVNPSQSSHLNPPTATTTEHTPPAEASAEPQPRVTPSSALNSATSSTSALRRPCSPSSTTGLSASPSSPKRVRAQPCTAKVMPVDYTRADPKDLCALIADMLMELIRYNDEIPLKDGHLTRFHSRAPPGISVHDYLVRLTVHATLPPPILLAMVFYIDRLCALYPTFTINSLTVHRFLITAATVASKGLSDSFWTNNTYARVGGVSVKELALLELELLSRVQWRIVPTPETLSDYYHNLVERSEGHVTETESSTGFTETDPGEPMEVEQQEQDAG